MDIKFEVNGAPHAISIPICTGYRLVAVYSPGQGGVQVGFQVLCETTVPYVQQTHAPGRPAIPGVMSGGIPASGTVGTLIVKGSAQDQLDMTVRKASVVGHPQTLIHGNEAATLIDFRVLAGGFVTSANFVMTNEGGQQNVPLIASTCARVMPANGFGSGTAGLIRWGPGNPQAAAPPAAYPQFAAHSEYKPVYQVFSSDQVTAWRTVRTSKNSPLDMLLAQVGQGQLDLKLEYKAEPGQAQPQALSLTGPNLMAVVYQELWGRFAPRREQTLRPPTMPFVPSDHLSAAIGRVLPQLTPPAPNPVIHEEITFVHAGPIAPWPV